MKRSESVLVYGVTGILVVILVVAVVFGGGQQTQATSPEEFVATGSNAGAGEDLTERAGDPDGFVDVSDESTEVDDAETAPGAAEEGVAAEGEQVQPGSEVPLSARAPSVQILIGPCRTHEQPDGSRFRIVRVRPGDTFSDIVQRFTGSLDHAAEVRALNEQLDPDRLVADQEIWLPWVEDDELIAAFESRRGAPLGTVAVRDAAATQPLTPEPDTAPEVAAAGTTHVLQPGESLWRLAEKKVGRGRAGAYVDEIVRLNAISDASRVQAGQKILLPATQ